ncbi:type I glyceraldehyde-3-phosphate dehydrogenase [Candidatus Saccharibacteria bacterium]|nr:type I glyceraldehyde-3-phosphate dehydrogenase [Candidatus Saccharibacteria bacterium]
MKTKIAINGFGRIGRNAFKIAFERGDLEILAVNDLTDTKTLAHLLKHDSNYGTYEHDVGFDDNNLIIKDQKIRVLSEKDPANLPWEEMAVEVVIESTGLFIEHEDLKKHLQAGAKKVVLSAPEKHEVEHDTYIIGVNDQDLPADQQIISNASCTTNCITPVAAIVEAAFGIEKAMMTTVHSYTASQRLQDAPAKDLREARNAATNIVPTTTGASQAAAKALPALAGIFNGLSIRVPTPVVSISDFSIVTKRDVTVEEVNEVFKKAAKDPYYQGIVDIVDEPLVSSDFIGNSHSAIVDLALTDVVGGNLLKVVAWYDNEWGYSNRLVEITADAGRLLHEGASKVIPESETVAMPESEGEKLLEPPDSAGEELLEPPGSSPKPADFSDEIAELDKKMAERGGLPPKPTPPSVPPASQPKSIDVISGD